VPNQLFGEELTKGRFVPFRGYDCVEREVSVPLEIAGDGIRSRVDYRLSAHDQPVCWVEVKSATLVENRRALFPDAVTERGRRHVLELAHLRETTGARACVVFIIQRPDVDSFSPQAERDPKFAQALRDAHVRGVEIYAYRCRLTLTSISVEGQVPVIL
jgi:sugar fermentation stimulation protein A